MKKFIIAVVCVMQFTAIYPAYADHVCRTYDYQEAKDMSDYELNAALDLARKFGALQLDLAGKMVRLGAHREYEKANEEYKFCDVQADRLASIKYKREQEAKKTNVPTYDECVTKMTSLTQDAPVIEKVCTKFKVNNEKKGRVSTQQ
jgi:hypothetical protein